MKDTSAAVLFRRCRPGKVWRITAVICPVSLGLGKVVASLPIMGTKPILAHPRFALAATVMVREAGTGAAVLAKLANISLSGCYLETPRQIPESARVRVVLQTSNLHADLWGVVQRRDAIGLGIRFTNGTTVEDWKRLECLIRELQNAVPAKSAAAPGSR